MSQHPRTAVILSNTHDYRSATRASMHPIAEALAGLGYAVRFISIGYSPISLLQNDRRHGLWRRANRVEQHGGVQCYLWRTAYHPVNPGVRPLMPLAAPIYRHYARRPNQFLDATLRTAALIIVESGLGVLFLRRARALNPTARLVYLASDDLLTIGAHPALQSELESCAPLLDQVCIPSGRMRSRFSWAGRWLQVVPHGVNAADFAVADANPYDCTNNAVSVGSMLFDPDFFVHASSQFPQVVFHLIGSGSRDRFPPNVRIHASMPFAETIPYLKNATIGIAPYRTAPGCEYLCDTSMKLMQYDLLGLPAVCPHFAVGSNPNRMGYTPGDPASIRNAVAAAIARGRCQPCAHYPTWREVTLQLAGADFAADQACGCGPTPPAE